MSRFLKIMLVLAMVAFIAFLAIIGGTIGLIGKLAEGSSSLGAKEKRPHLTVLKIEGPIMGSEAYLECIRRISQDDACKGVLLRVDSPGGAVGASQEIFSAVSALKGKGKPVVVSQGNLAASGGFYVSLAGDKIFSNPGTLTGSIGVILQFPEASKLMGKVGVDLFTVKSGPLKDVGNFSRPPTPEEIRYLQSVIDNTYNQFLDDILKTRKISRGELLKIADGRVMTGKQAKGYGLVDTLGGLREAEAYLAQLVKLEGDPVLVQEPPAKSWMEHLSDASSASKLGPLAEAAQSFLPWLQSGTFFIWK